MKKISKNLYIHLFSKQVDQYLSSHNLLRDKVVLSCSGGVDSISLLHIASKFLKDKKLKSLRAIHFNHGTRVEQKSEMELVKDICKQLEIDLEIISLNGLKDTSNFENIARKLRKKHLYSSLNTGEVIWEAHHIDDSFEWSLMNQTRTSSIHTSLGIPCLSKRIIRPFMSVTKSQIYKFANSLNIKWMEDSSNQSIKYDRNYFRMQVIPPIKKRNKQYLKHYVAQVNQWAQLLKVHQNKAEKYLSKKRGSGYSYYSLRPGQSIDLFIAEIEKEVSRLSNKNRGSVSLQLKKLNKMRKTGKEGPLELSGGVLAFSYPEQLLIVKKEFLDKWRPEKFNSSLEAYKKTLAFIYVIDPSISGKELKIQDYLTCQNYPKLLTFMQWIKRNKTSNKPVEAFTLN